MSSVDRREALDGGLAPKTLLIRFLTKCRCSKSLRNPANPLNSQHPLGSLPISPLGRSASAQTWLRTSALKVCSVQRRPATDGSDFITVTGLNKGRGSRIVIQGSTDQQLDPSGVSTLTPGREDGTTRGCILPQPMRQIPMIPTVLREREVPPNSPNEALSDDAPDIYDDGEPQSEVQNRGEHEEEGTVSEQSPRVPTEHAFGDYHNSGGTRDTVRSGTPRGRCR